MAPRHGGAPLLNTVDMAVQPGQRVQGPNGDEAALMQVQLRPPLLPESSGRPGSWHKIAWLLAGKMAGLDNRKFASTRESERIESSFGIGCTLPHYLSIG